MTTYFLVNLKGKVSPRHIKGLMDVPRSEFRSENSKMCFSNPVSAFAGSLSNDEILRKRNRIFDFEQKKQRENVGRIEKIEVRYMGTPNDATLVLNKNLSTPYNCAQREY